MVRGNASEQTIAYGSLYTTELCATEPSSVLGHRAIQGMHGGQRMCPHWCRCRHAEMQMQTSMVRRPD